jgi:hypothetical protein
MWMFRRADLTPNVAIFRANSSVVRGGLFEWLVDLYNVCKNNNYTKINISSVG